MYREQVWNKSQTHIDGRFNSGAFFIYLTVRPSTDGKRAPLTAINLQAAGSPQQAPPTYIAKMWKLIKFRKNVIFSRNHTDVNPDDWTITKKTIRTTIHENFSKMKNLKVDRWALSLMISLIRIPYITDCTYLEVSVIELLISEIELDISKIQFLISLFQFLTSLNNYLYH